MKVCVYAICKNESAFIPRWMNSMQEADAVYVLDTGSEDDSVELLRANGAIVHEERIEPWRFDTARNRSLSYVPEDTDICVCTDLDEVFHPGWRDAVERAWCGNVNQLRYRYTWNFNRDGSEGYVFYIEKIHARHGFSWHGAVHEVLRASNIVQGEATGVQLDHRADETKSRASYLPLLELAVNEEPDNDRNLHYLGREYMFYRRWDDAIRLLERHLRCKHAVWRDERCASMRFLSRCCREKGDTAAAEAWNLRAIAEAPHLREPWIEFAAYLQQQGDWHGSIFALERALAISERPRSYISEASSWGALPYDLLSLGYYYCGDLQKAQCAAEAALAITPDDARIRQNLQLIRDHLSRRNDHL